MSAAHEVLVDLVARRIQRSDHDRQLGAGERSREQGAEDRVLRQMGELAQDEIPRAEAGREARDR